MVRVALQSPRSLSKLFSRSWSLSRAQANIIQNSKLNLRKKCRNLMERWLSVRVLKLTVKWLQRQNKRERVVWLKSLELGAAHPNFWTKQQLCQDQTWTEQWMIEIPILMVWLTNPSLKAKTTMTMMLKELLQLQKQEQRAPQLRD